MPAYPEESIFENVFAERWCEEGSEEALRREQAGYPEPILWLDGRTEIISGERSAELYSCDDSSEHGGWQHLRLPGY